MTYIRQTAFDNIKSAYGHTFTRKYMFSRGFMWLCILAGMSLSFPQQFFAPFPKNSPVWMLQSFGFGLLFAGYTMFMSKTLKGILTDFGQKTKTTKYSDKVIFWCVLLFYAHAWYVITTNSGQAPLLGYTVVIAGVILVTCNDIAKEINEPLNNSILINNNLKKILKRSEFIS